MLDAASDFADHPRVINGCSDLLVAVFGQITVEIEMIVAVGD